MCLINIIIEKNCFPISNCKDTQSFWNCKMNCMLGSGYTRGGGGELCYYVVFGGADCGIKMGFWGRFWGGFAVIGNQ